MSLIDIDYLIREFDLQYSAKQKNVYVVPDDMVDDLKGYLMLTVPRLKCVNDEDEGTIYTQLTFSSAVRSDYWIVRHSEGQWVFYSRMIDIILNELKE